MEFNEPWFNTCSKIGFAARTGNLDLLKRFISENCPLDVADNRGWRPVHEAAVAAPSTDCLAELLNQKITNINWMTFENETALLLACKRRQGSAVNDFVKLLLQSGADANIPDNEGDTPLLEALRKENEYIVQNLVAAGADVNATDCSGWSPLHEAATKKDPTFVRFLLEKGANIDVRDECGMTPVFSAAQHGCEISLETLLIAARERGDGDRIVNMGAEDWATPLMITAQQGFVTCVKILLEYGANPNLKTSDNATALHMAVQANNTACLEILLKNMSIDQLITAFHPSTYEYSGMICPLHLAVEWENHVSLKVLLGAGFSPDSLYACSDLNPVSHIFFLPECETALSYACFKGDKMSIGILLNAGASPSPPVQTAFHPALRAMSQESLNELQILIESGTNLNYQRTVHPSNEVFLYSLLRGRDFLRLVLHHGCDPNLCFQSKNDVFQRCAGRYIKREAISLREFLRIIMRFLINSTNMLSSFLSLNARFPEDVSDILEEIDRPSPLQQICKIKIRQHLYSIHGVKLPVAIQQLKLPPILVQLIACSLQ